jgi:predicted alpha/beta hydrolase
MRKLTASLPSDTPKPVPTTIVAADGFALAAQTFAPRGRSLGTVIVHGATAVPMGYYRRFAAHLAARGLRTVTYDYRGVGESRPASLRGFAASMTDWAWLDARAVHRHVRRRHGHEPLVLVGHSFGGQLLGLIDDVRDATAVVTVGAQFGYAGHWPFSQRPKVELMWRVIVPALTGTLGYLPGWAGLGEDLPAGVAREWARWCQSPGYLVDHHRDALVRFARFERPVLAYSFSDDFFAPAPAVAAFWRALASATLDKRALTPDDVGGPVGHFGFFRPGHENGLWREATEWITAAMTGASLPERRPATLITEDELAADLGLPSSSRDSVAAR